MGSTTTPTIPIKLAELSIKKFNESGVPHHLSLLKNHKSNIEKLLALGDYDKIRKEEISATRVIKQLKNLLMEMDVLRRKLSAEDVAKFDKQILVSRQNALTEINSYLEINLKTKTAADDKPTTTSTARQQRYAPEYDEYNEDGDAANSSGHHQLLHCGVPQIQSDFQLSEHQLRSREACLKELENLHREINDLHSIFHDLHKEVVVQADAIDVIVDNVDDTQVHVEKGAQSLRQALSYKKAIYPMCGALIGTCLGGPVGLLAGLKFGGMAALTGGILGYTGGAAIKNNEEVQQQQIASGGGDELIEKADIATTTTAPKNE